MESYHQKYRAGRAERLQTWIRRGLVICGLVCLAASALRIGYRMWQERKAQTAGEEVLQELDDSLTGEVSQLRHMIDPNEQMPTEEIDGQSYIGRLDIPILGLSLPVTDAWNGSYPEIGSSRYCGSAYRDDLVLAAENDRPHFGKLKTLGTGDPVYLTDMAGNVFSYRVDEVEPLPLTGLDDLASRSEQNDCDLTLVACTSAGKARVAVSCTLMEQ